MFEVIQTSGCGIAEPADATAASFVEWFTVPAKQMMKAVESVAERKVPLLVESFP